MSNTDIPDIQGVNWAICRDVIVGTARRPRGWASVVAQFARMTNAEIERCALEALIARRARKERDKARRARNAAAKRA